MGIILTTEKVQNELQEYTRNELEVMNKGNWIIGIDKLPKGAKAKLYPTGNATFNGRIYVALPANMKITATISNKYNLFFVKLD